MNQLDALKRFTTVVADTGDFHQLAQYQPRDATTNPSLILKAVQKPEYAPLLADTVQSNRTWLGDFRNDEITISMDLYEVILAYQHYRRPSA